MKLGSNSILKNSMPLTPFKSEDLCFEAKVTPFKSEELCFEAKVLSFKVEYFWTV